MMYKRHEKGLCKPGNTCSLFSGITLVLLVLPGMWGCTQSDPRSEMTEIVLPAEQTEQRNRELQDELSYTLNGDLTLSLWASEELMSDPVALHMDDQGRAWLSVTGRRRAVDLDIRRHREWMIPSISFETPSDRRDFLHRELSAEHSDQTSGWLADFNDDGVHDWRDLTMHKESVYVLDDVDESGVASRSRLILQDFHEEITDVAGGVLYHEGDLFVGVAPDLWRIRDITGEEYAGEKESVVNGFGVQFIFAGHGVSGLTPGPDGRLYWSVGDMGLSVTDQEGKTWHNPRNGAILRADPDGSNFEVFAYGFRNVHEFAFDQYGNLIAVDNDGDHAGESEGVIYVTNGSDSGWRTNWQYGKYNDPKNNTYNVLMAEQYFQTRFEDQAAHVLPPIALYHNGPAGMAYNPGTALGEPWKNHFFVSEFTGTPLRSGINAFTLTPDGASFKLDKDENVLQGILATGLSFGPDGALYIADWIDSWELKGAGRIWKMDVPEEEQPAVRTETRSMLEQDFSGHDALDLLDLLKHPDMRVRQKSQFELVRRQDRETLQQVIEQTEDQLARIHGIWGLAQLGRSVPDAVEPLTGYLGDSDPEIRAQAAKMLGDVRYEAGGDFLIPLLQDESARVQYFAAEALGRMSYHPAIEPIVEMLERNNEEDLYLRLGGAIALERIGDEESLGGLASHPSRAVRIAAVVALKRLESDQVVHFLQDEDEFIVTNAARAINDDRLIEGGLPHLAAMLEQDRFRNEPLLRRAINANLLMAEEQNAKRLAAFAVSQEVPEGLRTEALQALSVWPEPSVLDRVTGDPRGDVRNDPEMARSGLEPVITDILGDEHPAIRIAGLDAASALHLESAAGEIKRLIIEDPDPDVRIASLDALAAMGTSGIEEAVYGALEDEDPVVRMNALGEISALGLPDESIAGMLGRVMESGSVREQQAALGTLAEIDHPAALDLLEHQLDLLLEGELIPELELDVVLAAGQSGSDTLNEMLQSWKLMKSQGDVVDAYRESLSGGDAGMGRTIFHQNEAAQCIRCHIVEGQGSDVGPDLTTIGTQLSRRELLESMIDPDARIAPGYGSVQLTLKNGEIISGLLKDKNETHITVSDQHEEWVVDRRDIAERVQSPSGMFAMGELLSRRELRDLVEFLQTLQ